MTLAEIKSIARKLLPVYIGILPLVLVMAIALGQQSYQQFSALANAFLQGKLYFLTPIEYGADTIMFAGKYYWPLGPFPAILLLPFVAIAQSFGAQFYDAYLHAFLFLGIFILVFYLAKALRYSFSDAVFWAYAFCFGSTLLSITTAAMSWQFAQIVTIFLLLFSLLLYQKKVHPLYIGILMGCVFATRINAGLGILFFILVTLTANLSLRNKIGRLCALLFPVLLAALLLGIYNFVRFGNFLEQGYSRQILYKPDLANARNYGLFSLAHLPGNLYYSILASPQPVFRDNNSHVLQFPFIKTDFWGLGIFFTSPYLIYMFFLNYKDRISYISWLTILIISLSIFLYYGIGYRQIGYRYALDFFPFLFFLLMRNYRSSIGQLAFRFRLFIFLSVIFNAYMLIFGEQWTT